MYPNFVSVAIPVDIPQAYLTAERACSNSSALFRAADARDLVWWCFLPPENEGHAHLNKRHAAFFKAGMWFQKNYMQNVYMYLFYCKRIPIKEHFKGARDTIVGVSDN